jgi:hypothetical protein
MKTRYVFWLAGLIALVAASPALWAQNVVEYDPFDVIAGSVALPASVNVSDGMTVSLADCSGIKVDRNRLIFDQNTCQAFKKDPLPQANVTLAPAGRGTPVLVKLEPRRAGDGGDGGFVAGDDGIKVSGLGAGPVAVFYSGRWHRFAIENGKVKLDDATRQALDNLGDQAPSLYIENRGRLHRVEIARTDAPDGDSDTKGTDDADTDELKCDSEGSYRIPDDAVVVCVDALAGQLALTQLISHVILPNKPIVVVVRHSADSKLRVEILGKRGLFLPGLRDQTPAAARVQSGKSKRAKARPVIAVHSFAPRQPGDADIRITLADSAGKVAVEGTVELTVEETYLGALRLGIAPIFGSAIENDYAVRVPPGSTQREIVAASDNDMDVQLVLGMAPFVFEWVSDRRGRSYFTGLNRRFAPYVGIGLLNSEKNSLQLTPSLHVGVELELTPHFSVALTAVGRNVTRLAPGFEIGSMVDSDEVPTITGFRFGWGVVFNFSPEFLRLASRSGSSFFGR